MHIKEIIIDGFKSYKIKASIQGLDRHFNAITGLNGSGKSNIFDAICFLLGISTLSHVRASNLQELVYNKGNTGITKASVTIIFDNQDKKSSPIGCEEYDEIIVCRTIYQGKSKYYLNGYTSSQESIKNLFQSVQLNINNPHFLILQGKIRQVVHMKPMEILGLLEEAAGTSIYELKKESSLKLIKKKENKLEEISKVLAEEISPQLEKLMKDKQNYLTWKNNESNIQRLTKILVAYDYYNHSDIVNTKKSELVQYKTQNGKYQAQINLLHKDISEKEEQIKKIEDLFKNEIDDNIKDLEKKFKDLVTVCKTNSHKLTQLEKSLSKGNKDIEKVKDDNQKLKMQIETSEKDKTDLQSNLEMFEKDFQNQKDFLKELEINLENAKVGKDNGSDLANLNKQINDCMNNKNKSTAEKKNLISQISFLSEEIKTKKLKLNDYQSKLNQSEKKYNQFQTEILKVEKIITDLETDNSSIQMIDAIQKQIQQKMQAQSQLESQQNEILNRYSSRVEVQFRDPEPNFDRTRVKGRVIRNFTLEEEKYSKAIEQTAGGKLYNIIVDSENTATLLLSRKCFDYGVVMIPLNKIQYKPIPQEKLQLIENISHGEAKLALDLINYDKQLETAMQFVFGTTFICTSSEVASKLAYTDNIRVKCVNLDGDIFDPQGLLTGGAPRQGESVLRKVVDLNNIQNRIEENKTEIIRLRQKSEDISVNVKKLTEQQRKLDTLKSQAEEFNKDRIIAQIQQLQNEIEQTTENSKRNEARVQELNEFEKKYTEDLKRLQSEQKEFQNLQNNTSKKKDIYAKKIQSTKKAIQEQEKKIDSIQKQIGGIDFKISELIKEVKENEESIISDQDGLNNTKNEIENLKVQIQKDNEEKKKYEAELFQKKNESSQNKKELNALRTEREELTNKRDSYVKEFKNLEDKIEKYEKELSDSENILEKLIDQNQWIPSEQSFFGMKDTDYDFSKFDVKKERERVIKMKDENALLKRKVNMKVEVVANEYEEQYNMLIKKKETIIKDKNNIQKAIEEMDIKRKIALEEIYEKVNESINSIYSSLLPGTKAKLNLINPNSLMDGVEMKVAFNNQWKSSLSELSGGQVSLLALSFILSLLLYKPAPIYIFDEIDAALDLSHTANLGLMLREHFPQSQFIVISLKDGMFNNANVLYKVSFVNGSSRVDRITKDKIQ